MSMTLKLPAISAALAITLQAASAPAQPLLKSPARAEAVASAAERRSTLDDQQAVAVTI